MSVRLTLIRVSPLTTLQDAGRPGARRHGMAASGPMDRSAYFAAGARLGVAGSTAIEFTRTGLAFRVDGGAMGAAFGGGDFVLTRGGAPQPWPARLALAEGDEVDISPGAAGNYGYARFDHEITAPLLLGSRSTNAVVGLGGLEGRPLRAGDVLDLAQAGGPVRDRVAAPADDGPIRFLWGLHAELFPASVRQRFVTESFAVSSRLDRMGVRLLDAGGVFGGAPILSLVSDAIVPGDIQILGDGTPIVLMRDHQPTGGYPRIGTVITADLDRFAQVRPGTSLAFRPVTLQKAQSLLPEAP